MYSQAKEKRDPIDVPGTYEVTITVAESTLTFKDKKPMFALVFEAPDKKSLRSVFTRYKKDGVTPNDFGMQLLTEIKQICGLSDDSPAQELLGKKLNIVCEWGDFTLNKDKQRVQYMNIKKYQPLGKAEPIESVPVDDIKW